MEYESALKEASKIFRLSWSSASAKEISRDHVILSFEIFLNRPGGNTALKLELYHTWLVRIITKMDR